jgi:hypothetical protein
VALARGDGVARVAHRRDHVGGIDAVGAHDDADHRVVQQRLERRRLDIGHQGHLNVASPGFVVPAPGSRDQPRM